MCQWVLLKMADTPAPEAAACVAFDDILTCWPIACIFRLPVWAHMPCRLQCRAPHALYWEVRVVLPQLAQHCMLSSFGRSFSVDADR